MNLREPLVVGRYGTTLFRASAYSKVVSCKVWKAYLVSASRSKATTVENRRHDILVAFFATI